MARLHGRTHEEAEDAAADFIAHLIESGARELRDDRRYSATAFRNFLANDWARRHAAKRGGSVSVVTLNNDDSTVQTGVQPTDEALMPDESCDAHWVIHEAETIVEGLRHDYDSSGRGLLFALLSPLIVAEVETDTLGTIAAQIGISRHAATMALHRLRGRFGVSFRHALRIGNASAGEGDPELNYVIELLSRSGWRSAAADAAGQRHPAGDTFRATRFEPRLLCRLDRT